MCHILFVTISIFVAIHKAAIIQPTSVNGNTENYITSSSTSFTNDTINCSAAICNIECDTHQGCYNANINEGASTTTINLLCGDYWSCYGLSLSANSITTFNVKCVGRHSCYNAQFNVDTATNIDIECNYNIPYGSTSVACYYTYLYARNSGTTNLYSTAHNTYYSYFYLNNTNTFNVNITGQRGFYFSYIYAEHANTININCDSTSGEYPGIYPCVNAILNGQYANTVNIDLYDQYGSAHSNWNVNNAQTVNYNSRGIFGSYYDVINASNVGTMTINCVSGTSTPSRWAAVGACHYNYWHIPADAAVNCYGTGCFNMYIYPTGGVFENLNFNIYSCAQCGGAIDCFYQLDLYCGSNFSNYDFLGRGVCGGDCCDTFINNVAFSTDINTDKCYTPITTTICQENQACDIVCDSTTQNCSNSIIDGSKASFLTVTCESSYYCQRMFTLCPNSGCDILCTGYGACSYNTVTYNGDKDDGAKVYIQCSGSNACQYMRLNARNAYWVDIAASRYGYSDGELHVNNVSKLTINATGNHSFYNNLLYADNAGYMVLGCQSDVNEYACYKNHMYLPDNPIFLCYGWGCYYLRDIYFDNVNNNAIWNVYGCGQCDSALTCINAIDISCGRRTWDGLIYSYLNTFFYNYGPPQRQVIPQMYGNCTMPAAYPISEDCGCYELFNQRIQYQQTQGGGCTVQFSAIRAPTSSTMNPTDGPTQNPTLPTISPSAVPTTHTLSPTLPTMTPSVTPTMTTTISPTTGSPTTGSPTDITSAPTGQEPGGNVNAANVISIFISFVVPIAIVIRY